MTKPSTPIVGVILHGGEVIGQVTHFAIDIDDNVKRPLPSHMVRRDGEFFPSGTSKAPTPFGKFRQHSPRYMRNAPKDHSSSPMFLMLRQARLNHEMKAARDSARVRGIPSFERSKDEATGITTAAGGFVMA